MTAINLLHHKNGVLPVRPAEEDQGSMNTNGNRGALPFATKWSCGQAAILASAPARRHAALVSLVQLVYSTGRPLVGAMTLLFEGHALHFGTASPRSARLLSLAHRDALPDDPERPSRFRSGLSDPDAADTPEELGFDLHKDDLGLVVDRSRRFPLPDQRDQAPGQWVHPVVKIHGADFFVRLLSQRNLGLGECFLENRFEMLRGSIYHLLAFFQVNETDRAVALPLREKARLMGQYLRWRFDHSHNEDIADHYDMGDNVMVPMLGATGCYSCGYAEKETDDLDRMQVNKMNLIFSKMRLTPGMRVLDTGCGNGGMLVHAATAWGCQGVGFTNSYNMASLARRNAEKNGVADKITIHHADFSLLRTFPDGHFDAIYEVGVWEHLRFSEYREVMTQCHRILSPHGRMLIHSMASHERVHQRDGYIQKYIFRDSNQIRLHLLAVEASRLDMLVADVENIGRHYYWTCWRWRENLLAAYERDPSISDRNFRVMLYFLECGMSASRFGSGALYHILVFKESRDYTTTWRVDARQRDVSRGGMVDAALRMAPNHHNTHVHNDQNAPDKLLAPVYARPGLARRIGQLVDIIRSVNHQ
jgi:cyclopropane-fatty-acyl-phospholipid synthase